MSDEHVDAPETAVKKDFIRNTIREDLTSGKHQSIVVRFPPEPNGYLHIGHAKSICLNFGLANEFAGVCHLRFDDTNPLAEDTAFTQGIEEDVKWLGFDWGDNLFYASNYFEKLYQLAMHLIEKGLAYVDDQDADTIRATRGTLKSPGTDSPYRNRSIEENKALFEKMRAGEFKDGECCLRAKIDMQAGNINMRDPVIYRIRHTEHHRSGDAWCIYPLYDFTHALSDAIENITHSLCTLEFQDHRPLYDWFVANCDMPHAPRQMEFSRLNLSYVITSKRKLKQMVQEGIVDGWDDPRLSTLRAFRRRGVPPEAIRNFCADLGVSKQDSVIDMEVLDSVVRDELNQKALRRNVILDPVKVTITNMDDDESYTISVANHPQDESKGRRELTFTKNLWIDRSDFQKEPEKKFHRLYEGNRVRCLQAFVMSCDKAIYDDNGEVVELLCSIDKDTLGGKKPADGKKVKGFIHWLSADTAKDATVRVYDRLFKVPNPAVEDDWHDALNPDSLQVFANAKAEPALVDAKPEERFQFTRMGYYVADRWDHKPEENQLVFNCIVPLRSNW